MNWGTRAAAIALFLPVAILWAVTVVYLQQRVPRLISDDRARAGRAYRELAEELYADSTLAQESGDRPKGWRQNGKVGGKGSERVSWGHVRKGERELVWLGDEHHYRAVWSEPLENNWLEVWFYYITPAILVALTAIAVFCVWVLVRSVRARDEFLSATAHDLTTPLVGMRGLIGHDDAEAQKLNDRMLRLVDNLKDFLARGGRRRKPKMERFEIGSAFAQAYTVFEGDFAEETSGPVQCSGEADLSVMADETMTTQILWNLLGNDLKYAAPYGPVEVNFSRRAEMVAIDFFDRGPGMTRRQRKRAFNRYYRASTVLKSGKGGFGIGLCTSREFALAMGGDLKVDQREGGGSVFTLLLLASENAKKEKVS